MLPPVPAAPLPLHESTRPKQLELSPSPLSPPVVVLLGSRINRIPRSSICACHRSPPAATSRTDIAIITIEEGNCDLQGTHPIALIDITGSRDLTLAFRLPSVSSSSLFAPLTHHFTNRDNTTTSNDIMTRTHKGNDRDHVGLANGTAVPEEHLPRYFGKAGFAGTNPAETKKKGSGKGNWGQAGISELEDYDYNSLKPRRRSNSMSLAAGHSALKTKFEAVDEDAIEFDEALHGPRDEDLVDNHLEKMSTASSSADTMGSIEEEMDAAAANTAAVAGAAGQKK
ncbi:hypothetical protein KC332_g13868 [Hortaea werneckii]|nr:hypothetical protein KC358_g13918 [Hortaea werneckii]KAI6828338.1 hypothetical protein KC350_g8105 [Hortaea werneckii]KAI6908389.1 hypothetical protein KC348_g13858 [Hortaea werneckii]KAI6933069.1 hypothetical protein KC341_g8550 [Hortaea werneckii]KAI6959079.1 hypothetical protein KC321_g13631 [Hortaea werneckii]